MLADLLPGALGHSTCVRAPETHRRVAVSSERCRAVPRHNTPLALYDSQPSELLSRPRHRHCASTTPLRRSPTRPDLDANTAPLRPSLERSRLSLQPRPPPTMPAERRKAAQAAHDTLTAASSKRGERAARAPPAEKKLKFEEWEKQVSALDMCAPTPRLQADSRPAPSPARASRRRSSSRPSPRNSRARRVGGASS